MAGDMRVGINVYSFLKTAYTGTGRYAYHLVKELLAMGGHEYVLYAPKRIFDFRRRVPSFDQGNYKIVHDYYRQGAGQAIQGCDLYHAPTVEMVEHAQPVKIVGTIHDVVFKAYPQGHASETIDYLDKQTQSVLTHATKVMCSSQSTLDDVVKHYQIDRQKLSVVPLGVDTKIFYPPSLNEARILIKTLGLDQPYFLFVGTIEPRKNLEGVLRAFHQLKTRHFFQGKLVVAGMKGWMTEGLADIMTQLDLEAHVCFVGFVADEVLRALYALSEAFVFPSFYEGFGFPILEAFCCGAPVITAHNSSCAEVAGDAAILVDPNSVEAIASSMVQILEDHDTRNQLIKKGNQRYVQFSFQQTAQQTLAVYQEVISA